jgi:hypothetical protein
MRIGIYATSAAALLSFAAATVSRAEPTLTSGIGLASCAKLGPDLKPGAGLDHVPNALLFYSMREGQQGRSGEGRSRAQVLHVHERQDGQQ